MLALLQRTDPPLAKCFAAVKIKDDPAAADVGFCLKGDVLMHKWTAVPNGSDWNSVYQVVAPSAYQSQILAHDNAMSGHLGLSKTYS